MKRRAEKAKKLLDLTPTSDISRDTLPSPISDLATISQKQNRKISNKASARASRERKKLYVTQLEEQVKALKTENAELLRQNQALRHDNTELFKKNRELTQIKQEDHKEQEQSSQSASLSNFGLLPPPKMQRILSDETLSSFFNEFEF